MAKVSRFGDIAPPIPMATAGEVETNEAVLPKLFMVNKGGAKRVAALREKRFGIAEDQMAAQGNPDDLIEVSTTIDYEHTVGNTKYQYLAFEPMEVPRSVAAILQEAGVLFVGGATAAVIKQAQINSIKNIEAAGKWRIPKPIIGG
jgi:hypothetical protein